MLGKTIKQSHVLLLISIFLLGNFDAFSQEEEQQIKKDTMSISKYRAYGVNINFKGSIRIIKNDFDEKSTYFYKSIEIIRFTENNRVDYSGQYLLSEINPPLELMQSLIDTSRVRINHHSLDEDESSSVENIPKAKAQSSLNNSFSYYSYYSSLYILPKISIKKLKKEITAYVKNNSPFQVSEKFEEIKIENKKGYKWRIQSGKTRLDHYIFFGEEYNYLFVSSPYGSNGIIEDAILGMELL